MHSLCELVGFILFILLSSGPLPCPPFEFLFLQNLPGISDKVPHCPVCHSNRLGEIFSIEVKDALSIDNPFGI